MGLVVLEMQNNDLFVVLETVSDFLTDAEAGGRGLYDDQICLIFPFGHESLVF